MSRTINTRTRYKIIGSDYSAQEPRMTTFLSKDPTMYEAYKEGKDLYAMIAQSAYHNDYFDNLEFYKEFTKVEVDGKETIAGTGKTKGMKTDEDNSITVPACYLLPLSENEDIPANQLKEGMKILSDQGMLTVSRISPAPETVVNGLTVENLKITF